MQLFYAIPSPYARKARVMAIESGLADQIDFVTIAARPDAPDPVLQAANPLGKIPALVRDDGSTIHDSRVIARYFDAQAGTNFYADDRLWEVLTLESLASGIMDAAVNMIYEQRFRAAAIVSHDWLNWQWFKVESALDALRSDWADHLIGPLCAGQMTVGCALGYLDFRHGPRNWRDGRPDLARWSEEFAAHPSMQMTAPHD